MYELLAFYAQAILVLAQEIIWNFFALIFRWKKPKSIDGQLVLVTGGARGLGKAIATRLAREKCNIAICDINIEEAAKTSQELRQKHKILCEAFKADISDTDQVDNLYNEIEEKMGIVDILVNNAGVLAPLGILEGKDSDISRVLKINLTSHFWMIRKFLPSMIKQKRGHILGISSVGGKATIPFAGSYCASKFGVNGFYRSLYDDICVYGYDNFIKITCAFPGFINTRNDLENLLDETNEYIPRIQPEHAADEIVKAMLLDKREILFPFIYKLVILAEYLLPSETLKFIKKGACKKVVDLDKRIRMART